MNQQPMTITILKANLHDLTYSTLITATVYFILQISVNL